MKKVKFAKNGYQTVMNDELAAVYAKKKVKIDGEEVPKIKILGNVKEAEREPAPKRRGRPANENQKNKDEEQDGESSQKE
jgi:hypothetical protein